MKRRFDLLILLLLVAALTAVTACSRTPENNSQRSGNANAAQSNSSPASTSQQPDQSKAGTIEITSVPPGAKVLLVSTDEGGAGEPQPKGLTPATITRLSPGTYTVDLERSGYKFYQKEVVVKEGKTTKVSATLRKQ